MARSFVAVLALSLCCVSAARQIQQVQLLHRHGDRAPLASIPKDPVDWVAALHTQPGQLTGAGFTQAMNLGVWLRNRYVDELGLLDEDYLASEVYVQATDVDRTIMTANLVLKMLFKKASREDDLTNVTVADAMQPPVHMVTKRNNVLQAVDLCPEVLDHIIPAMTKTPEWRQKEDDTADLIAEMKELGGFEDIPLDDFYGAYDPIFVQYTHHLLNISGLVERIDDIVAVADWSAARVKAAGGPLVGGPLLNRFGVNMKAMVDADASAKKFVQYSAHDSTLLSLASAMELTTNPLFQRIPSYASALLVELWKEDDGSLSVSGLFRDGVSGQVSNLTLPTTYDGFQKLAATNGLDDEAWCTACDPSWGVYTGPEACIRAQYEDLLDNDSDDDDDDNTTPLIAAVGVLGGLLVVAVGALAWLQLRRRSDGRALRTPLVPSGGDEA